MAESKDCLSRPPDHIVIVRVRLTGLTSSIEHERRVHVISF